MIEKEDVINIIRARIWVHRDAELKRNKRAGIAHENGDGKARDRHLDMAKHHRHIREELESLYETIIMEDEEE